MKAPGTAEGAAIAASPPRANRLSPTIRGFPARHPVAKAASRAESGLGRRAGSVSVLAEFLGAVALAMVGSVLVEHFLSRRASRRSGEARAER